MRRPRTSLITPIVGIGLLHTFAVAESPRREGRLIYDCDALNRSGALSADEVEKYCRWMVRYQGFGAARSAPETPRESADRKAIQTVLGSLRAIQPAQFQGSRSSLLAEKPSGELVVVSLEKTEGIWRITSVTENIQQARR